MTNKDNLKKVIETDFDLKNNYKKIMEGIEKKKMKKVWKWAFVPVCLIVGVCCFSLLNLKNNKIILEKYKDEVNEIVLNINNLENVGMNRIDADVKHLTFNEVDLIRFNAKIPEDLTEFDNYGIYTRKDKNSEYNILNCYVRNYSNENRNVRIASSNTNKPIRDYIFDEEGSKITNINGVYLKIFKYNTLYFTEFSYHGLNYDIETNNISEQEFADLIVSIINS